jgi:flagellar basal-body rod protein FlgF
MLANNLANVETGGYKADREFYSVYSSLDATADAQTGEMSTLPVIENHWTDLAQGEIRNTTNPLDFAIDGDGLFAVQTARGVRYTRNGNFKILSSGALATNDGSTVRAQGGGPDSSTAEHARGRSARWHCAPGIANRRTDGNRLLRSQRHQ